MKNRFYFMLLLLCPLFLFTRCDKDDDNGGDDEGGDSIDDVTLKVNKFISDVMSDAYLWCDEMPDVDYTKQADSEKYFDTLLYVDDKWSYITDDLEALEGSLEGNETSYGWALAFGLFSNTGNVFAIVEYVYPETPAAEAGLKRGDIIVQMDGADITTDNYTDLLYSSSMSVTTGIYDKSENTISAGSTYSLTSKELSLNPVLKTAVVEEDGYKIGYIFYAQYIKGYNTSLDTALQSMVDKNVTDLVLDLRYNSGGHISAAQHLCSSLAPVSVVNSNSTLVTFEWNDKYQTYWEQNNTTSQLKITFDSDVTVKMGLNSLHVLTGSGTASASELTITGLSPYMDVTTIGDTTYGKYTGSTTFSPEDLYEDKGTVYYGDFDNWGLMPIIIRYANSEGVTDFKNGFAPDYLVSDNLFDTYPLGNPNDPLFAAAIADITGGTVAAVKSTKMSDLNFTIFDQGFSKFDENKRELIIDKDFLQGLY